MSEIDQGTKASSSSPTGAAPLRLIHLIAQHNRHPTGMTTVFEEIAEQAKSRGWSFEIGVPRQVEGAGWVEELAARGTTVHFIDYGKTREMSKRIAEVLGDDPGPALVHCHLSTYDLAAATACRKRDSVSLVWHVHSVLPEGLVRLARTRVKFATFGRRVDGIVIPFENTREDLIRRGAAPDDLIVFPGSVDPDDYPWPSAEERRLARHGLGVPEHSFLLLHFGWHWYEKGGDQFVEMVRLLVDAGVPVVGLVNRGGEAAERSIAQHGLTDVIQVGGLVEDSRDLFVAADCMVGPSRAEGLTFTYLEGLAAGLPLVATNLPGEHYLYDRLRGMHRVLHEPADLAAGVREILERSDEERTAAAAEVRQWLVEERSVHRTVADLFDAVRADRRRSGPARGSRAYAEREEPPRSARLTPLATGPQSIPNWLRGAHVDRSRGPLRADLAGADRAGGAGPEGLHLAHTRRDLELVFLVADQLVVEPRALLLFSVRSISPIPSLPGL